MGVLHAQTLHAMTCRQLGRAVERIIGPWESFNYKCCSFVTKGVWRFSPRKKFFKILENGAILCILVAPQNGL